MSFKVSSLLLWCWIHCHMISMGEILTPLKSWQTSCCLYWPTPCMDTTLWTTWGKILTNVRARAAGRVVSSIKLSVMWWLNFISCLIKQPFMLWDNNCYAIDGKHRVTGRQMKGWCLSLPQNWGFSLCYSILRLTYTQVSSLKGDLISWFSFQNTRSPIFLSLTSN